MKQLFLLIIFASSNIYAESRVLPPVIDNSTYIAGSAYKSTAPSANAMYELLGRLEQMQSELQLLRGVVEEQSQTINDLKKRQGNIYSDLDQRLQELTGVSGETKLIVDNNTESTQINTTINTEIGSQSVVEQGIDEIDVAEKNATHVAVVAPGIVEKNQKLLYQTAYETLRNGHNTRAIQLFNELLAEFPDGEYADNTQYWLGEAYKVNQDLNSAKSAFKKVVSRYGSSTKVPDALLKLGYIELEQNNMAKARDYLTQVTVNHPSTTAAHLAAKKLVQLGVMQP